MEYKGVEAYFIKVRSKELKGKLFEIVLKDYNIILHSTNELILKRLREEEVFSEGSREISYRRIYKPKILELFPHLFPYAEP